MELQGRRFQSKEADSIRPAASATRIACSITSGPIPSPPITAMRRVAIARNPRLTYRLAACFCLNTARENLNLAGYRSRSRWARPVQADAETQQCENALRKRHADEETRRHGVKKLQCSSSLVLLLLVSRMSTRP